MHWNAVCALLSFFIDLGFLLQVYAKRKDSNGYRTTYACEGKTLHILCNDGIIHLIRANYGRFSISICNDHGNLDWSVNCMSHQSFLVMQDRCSFKPNCSINVSSNTFHDPCPGTLKYLEVQYHCGKDVPSISIQPSSSSHLQKTSPPTNTTTSSGLSPAIPSLIFTTSRTTVTTEAATTPPSTVWLSGKEIFVQPNTTIATEEPYFRESLTSSTVDYSNANYCTPIFARGINWMWTKSGETAVEKCPEGATGTARWHCLIDTVEWNPEQPDLHLCRSMWLENLKERLESGENIITVTSELAVKSLAKPLFSADLQIISDMIKQALYKSANSMENFLDTWHRYHVLRELLQSFVQILNNLLENKQNAAWTDLPPHDRKIVISSLLHGLDESALLLSEISSDDGSFSLVKNNVLLSLEILNAKTSTSFYFPMQNEIAPDDKEEIWLHMQDSVFLPRQAVKDYVSNGLYKVVFTAYNKLNYFLKPSTSFLHQSDDPVSGNVTRIINSKIIGASLDRGGYPKLHQPAVITFKHLIEENVTNPLCVYWDFHFRDWSTQGCWVQKSNRTHTVCFCEHLTNFALLMDFQTDIVVPPDIKTLHVVIAIGCSIAIVSLLITVVVMFVFSLDIPDESLSIYRNMFICLLLSEILLVGGLRQTVFPLACAIIAGFLQFLLLATFSWMFLDCFHQYSILFRSSKNRNAIWYYLVAYLTPGLVTGISAAANPSNYGSGEYCWLQSNNYFIFSFAAPAAIIILGGFIFIIRAVCILYQTIAIIDVEVVLLKHRSWNRRSIFLIILTSITWSVGILFLSQESLLLAYTFSVLNSSHGVAILMLYCFCYEKVSRDLRSIFSDIFWKKRKEQESQISEQSVNTSEALQSERFHTLKEGKLYEKPPIQDYIRSDVSISSGNHKFSRGTIGRGTHTTMKWDYASRNALEGNTTDSSSSGDCRQNFATSPESSGQFFEHIYEAIDDETTKPSGLHNSGINRGFPPPENYYGDHSDISQQSSASSCYNQQAQITECGQSQNIFPSSYTMVRSPSQCHPHGNMYTWGQYNDSILEQETDKILNPLELNTTLDENCQSSGSVALWQKDSSQNWEQPLTNILQSPTKNNVVLAVLEGDKVVSRIQQDNSLSQQQYKLSSYY